MKLTKRILSFVMAMLMLFTGMAVTASADGEATVQLISADLNMEARTLKLNKLADASGWSVTFETTPSTNAAPTFLTETEEAFFYCNLIAGTKYKITAIAVVDGAAKTQVLNLELLLPQNAPGTPVPKKITTTSIEVNLVSGCEYRLKGDEAFVKTTTFSDLVPGQYYTIEMRYAKTPTHYASPVSSATIRTLALPGMGIPTLPAIEDFLVDKTNKTITVKEFKDIEYSIDNGKTWQVSGHFTGLNPDTTYGIIARYKFDASVQAPNPSSAPVEIRTNVRESYPADIKNCKFTAPTGKNYANQPIAISVTADTPAKYHDTQFGDTKYVPSYFTIDDGVAETKFTSSDGKIFKSTFTPGDAKANKKVAINVYYNKMKCVGEEPNGDAKWIVDGEVESKTYYVQVGEVYTSFTNIRDMFLKIFNFFFNEIPAKINEMIKGSDFNLGDFLNTLNVILKMFGGGTTGGTTGGIGDIGGLLGGLTQ